VEYKRWQNLIHRKCPTCDSKLEWGSNWFVCPDNNCKFMIHGSKIVEILTGPMIRRFLSEHEESIIDNAISDLIKAA